MQTAQPSQETPTTQAPVPIPEQQERPIITGCDGICDAFEQSHTESSCYKPDCLGIIDEQAMPPQPANPSQQPSNLQQPEQQEFVVEATNSTYAAVDTMNKPTGWLETGQSADIMLSGIGFNNTGGPLLFNHPGVVASDGTHLLLADRNNNRVLVWNELPDSNKPPDLVLGQNDFYTNNPGTNMNELNWPVSVAAADGKVIVADTYNDRLLIWNTFPTENGQPADIEIKDGGSGDQNPKRKMGWPWAVWTNGEKLVVTSTASSAALIWNTFPTEDNEPADVLLTANGKFGTPRSIGSDGRHLMIGDHNAKVNDESGNFFWKTFPTHDDEPYDFFMATPMFVPPPRGTTSTQRGSVFYGATFTPDDKFLVLALGLDVWNEFPQHDNDTADLIVGNTGPSNTGYTFRAGDGSGAYAGARLYLSLANGNKIVVYNTFPNVSDQKPDFAVGAPDIDTDTLETNFIISNAVPATDGKSLFVTSDFDRKLYVWKNLPDQSNAHPDWVYKLPDGPWDNALFENTFAAAGRRAVYIWTTLPTQGQEPDIILTNTIGNVQLQELRGVAMDEKYFYLADEPANKVYVWEGIPESNSDPKFTLSVNGPYRLSSDGEYLVVTSTLDNEGGHVKIYPINSLGADSRPALLERMTNLPQYALVTNGSLMVADTSNNRVLIWERIEDAMAGNDVDVILGAEDLNDITPEIGRDTLFWPAGLAFDGSYLWVGEFKFSERIVRFSVQ